MKRQSILDFVENLFGRRSSRRSRSRAAGSAEFLEVRSLLSALSLSGGSLTYTAGAGVSNAGIYAIGDTAGNIPLNDTLTIAGCTR